MARLLQVRDKHVSLLQPPGAAPRSTIRMPGFILPLDYQPDGLSAEVSEFLLVPYVGACIHVPPPPPNQLVYVGLEESIVIEELWEPIWIIGTLTAEPNHNALGNTAYSFILEETEPYEY